MSSQGNTHVIIDTKALPAIRAFPAAALDALGHAACAEDMPACLDGCVLDVLVAHIAVHEVLYKISMICRKG